MLPEPKGGYLPSEEARAILSQFVEAGNFDGPTAMPKTVSPTDAALFVEKRLLGETTAERHLAKIGELMRFFDLRPQADGLLRFLDRKESSVLDWGRSVKALELLGDLGNAEAQEAAGAYFSHLATHPAASGKSGALVDLVFHLPPSTDVASVKASFEERKRILKPKVEEDDDIAIEYYAIDDLLNDRLPTVVKARDKARAAAAQEDIKKRRQELLLFYLELEKAAYVDLCVHGSMMLQRDCNETEPPQLAAAFVQGLEIIRSKAGKRGALSEGDEKDLARYVTRCGRGVGFYLGELEGELKEYFEKHHAKTQEDLLHWG